MGSQPGARSVGLALLFAVLLCAVETPIPNAQQLKQRVIDNQKRSVKLKERYLCQVTAESFKLDGNGNVTSTDTKQFERFFVNGQEIDRLISKNGKVLSAKDEEKATDSADKKAKKFSDPKELRKVEQEQQHNLDVVLKALRYEHGRREFHDGQTLLTYDLTGDPNFHPSSIEERFAKAVVGRIWIEESTGELADLQVRTNQDVKVAGGLLATLHKGFTLQVRQTRQPDGVWLASLVTGSGDARAGLFFHPRFRFRQSTGNCRLYNVDSTSTPQAPAQ